MLSSLSSRLSLLQFSCCTSWVSGLLMVLRSSWGWLKTRCRITCLLAAHASAPPSPLERPSARGPWCRRDRLQWWSERLHTERWEMPLCGVCFTTCSVFCACCWSLCLHQVNVDYTEKTVSISNYPLSAALTCAKMCSAFEEVWGVLWPTVNELLPLGRQ